MIVDHQLMQSLMDVDKGCLDFKQRDPIDNMVATGVDTVIVEVGTTGHHVHEDYS